MVQQDIAPFITEVVVGTSSLIVLIFKYRELLGFTWKLLKLSFKPVLCVIRWIKLARKIEQNQEKNDERIANLEKSILELTSFVREKLSPNGGSSPVDAIKRIENCLAVSEARQIALLNSDQHGIFYCDLQGKNTWVNRTYARFLGCGTNELMGFGWKKFIQTEELARYAKVWEAAFKDGCEFEDTVTFVNASNEKVNLHISVSMVTNEKGQIVSYIGQVVAL
jgi:PAS domain S-box-containing protein